MLKIAFELEFSVNMNSPTNHYWKSVKYFSANFVFIWDTLYLPDSIEVNSQNFAKYLHCSRRTMLVSVRLLNGIISRKKRVYFFRSFEKTPTPLDIRLQYVLVFLLLCYVWIYSIALKWFWENVQNWTIQCVLGS